MADPAEDAARNAGNPTDEEERPDIETIRSQLKGVKDGDTWASASVMAAKRDLLACCTEIERLRSLAGITE